MDLHICEVFLWSSFCIHYIFNIKILQEISENKMLENISLNNYISTGLSRRKATTVTHGHAHIYN